MTGNRTTTACVAAVIAVTQTACGTRTRAGEGAEAARSSAPPTLVRVAPDTIDIGQGAIPTLSLTGRDFVPGGQGGFGTGGGNVVRVGALQLTGIPADSAGTTIRFMLPLRYNDSTLSNRPAAFIPGQYPVSVTTPRGTSNALTLTMIP
ncbi:MAG: hypothetical protein ABI877_02755 [Gemmatimonadaceae bacterium]